MIVQVVEMVVVGVVLMMVEVVMVIGLATKVMIVGVVVVDGMIVLEVAMLVAMRLMMVEVMLGVGSVRIAVEMVLRGGGRGNHSCVYEVIKNRAVCPEPLKVMHCDTCTIPLKMD
jgi:hypothetical protein